MYEDGVGIFLDKVGVTYKIPVPSCFRSNMGVHLWVGWGQLCVGVKGTLYVGLTDMIINLSGIGNCLAHHTGCSISNFLSPLTSLGTFSKQAANKLFVKK